MQIIKSYDKETKQWVAINAIEQESSGSNIDEAKVNSLIDTKIAPINTKNNSQDSSISTLNSKVSTLESNYNELFTSASNGKELVANAITGKGVPTSKSDTFATMASNINKIETGSGSTNSNEALNITVTDGKIDFWEIYNTKNNPVTLKITDNYGFILDSNNKPPQFALPGMPYMFDEYAYIKHDSLIQRDNNYYKINMDNLTINDYKGHTSEIVLADCSDDNYIKITEMTVGTLTYGYNGTDDPAGIGYTDIKCDKLYMLDNSLNNFLSSLPMVTRENSNWGDKISNVARLYFTKSYTDTQATTAALQHATDNNWTVIFN